MTQAQIDSLALRLEAASRTYYENTGEVLISDAEYDALEDSLRKLDPANPVFARVGAPLTGSGWQKVKHPVPMGSLDKAQIEGEFRSWSMKQNSKIFCVTEKLDGISVLLTYDKGVLVRAATRGDGLEGEVITRNVRIMKGVPATVPNQSLFYVRGEIICRKSDFATHFPGESNPRNTASGTSKRQTGWQKAKHLTVIAYNLNVPTQRFNRCIELETLKNNGFTVPFWDVCNEMGVISLRDRYLNGARDALDYEIDGLVVEIDGYNDREAMGETNMRPKGAVAFKFPHDSKKSTLRNIVWQVGNSGRITPVAEFDTVSLAGANVKQASLHNLANIGLIASYTGNKTLGVGDEILVSRRNDVIPYVEKRLVEGTGLEFTAPTVCPACNAATQMSGEYLVCRNENCPAQTLGLMKRWITKVNILHFGDSMLEALVEAGMVSTIGDLYRLDWDAVAETEMEGRKIGGMVKRAQASIDASRELPVDLFVGSLGIELVGRDMTLVLVEAGYDDLDKLASVTESQMAAIPGFGAGRASSFRKGFDAKRPLILDILSAGVTITEPVRVAVKGASMAGQAVCMTGFRDAAMEQRILEQGGTIASGVSKNTSILVAKDPSSGSGKAQKANQLGVRVLGIQEMWTLLGGI